MSPPVLDTRNLMCPLPVIRTQQKIEALNDGDELLVVATDPGALHDIPAWCRVHGHRIISAVPSGNEYQVHVVVCKSGSD